jgi:hypothetical protein
LYKIVAFYRFDCDYVIKTFNLLSDAEEYYDSIADSVEYEGYHFGMVVMYYNNQKIKEFR